MKGSEGGGESERGREGGGDEGMKGARKGGKERGREGREGEGRNLMTIPFSMEKESVGSPAMFQSRIFTGSPRVEVREKSAEQGMFRCWHI